jgi:N-acetylglucosamine-6-phosphate deacetylase
MRQLKRSWAHNQAAAQVADALNQQCLVNQVLEMHGNPIQQRGSIRLRQANGLLTGSVQRSDLQG